MNRQQTAIHEASHFAAIAHFNKEWVYTMKVRKQTQKYDAQWESGYVRWYAQYAEDYQRCVVAISGLVGEIVHSGQTLPLKAYRGDLQGFYGYLRGIDEEKAQRLVDNASEGHTNLLLIVLEKIEEMGLDTNDIRIYAAILAAIKIVRRHSRFIRDIEEVVEAGRQQFGTKLCQQLTEEYF